MGKEKLEIDKEYLNKRKLCSPAATSFSIWAIIVGCVISGEFSGYNVGLAYGLGSMIVAHVIGTYNISCELGTAFPFASGCASYAAAAFGPVAACLIGYSYTLEMILINTQVTTFVGQIISDTTQTASQLKPLWWSLSIIFCGLINMKPKIFFRVITVFSTISVLILLVVLAISIPHLNFVKAWETILPDGSISTAFLPFGIAGVIKSIPYSLYLLICFEVLPCCAEETVDVGKNLHRGMGLGMLTLILCSWPTLILTAAFPTTTGISSAPSPMGAVLQAVFKSDSISLAAVGIPAIVTSQLAIFYAGTRFVYGLARGGYLPTKLALTTKADGAPYVSIIVNLVLILTLSLVISNVDATSRFAEIFLNAGTMFAFCAYIFEPIVFIKLRYSLPTLPRTFKSPLGVAGAVLNFSLALFAIVGQLIYVNLYRYLLATVACVFLLSVPFFFLVVKKNLQVSPEKIFISHQLKERYAEKINSINKESSRTNITKSDLELNAITQATSTQPQTPSSPWSLKKLPTTDNKSSAW
ncbi:hypothetical protein HK099_005522 [Clydaea vesicula]|uniref:Uncharacterized protein n=1 Tax=Clydaea vesicula TaxID=447962 RepID=A0AAD5TYS2_9FUNG|nr:hypothetical protein HK099_005522 [Clydaea vesicula]